MNTITRWGAVLVVATASLAAATALGTIHGTVQEVDASARTIIVRTAEGTEHTLHLVEKTTVHKTEAAAKGSWRELEKGAEVAVHYTTKGAEKTAVEIDRLGKGGLRTMDGTLVRVDHGARTVVVKGADGAEETFRVTGRAGAALGKDAVAGTEKSTKVTVYYTEVAGRKVVHFFHI